MIQVFAQTGPDKNIDPAETAPDQGLPCLPFRLHVLDTLLYDKTTLKISAMLQVPEFFRFTPQFRDPAMKLNQVEVSHQFFVLLHF